MGCRTEGETQALQKTETTSRQKSKSQIPNPLRLLHGGEGVAKLPHAYPDSVRDATVRVEGSGLGSNLGFRV